MPIGEVCHIDDYALSRPKDLGRIRIAPSERSIAPAPIFSFGPIPDHLNRSLFAGLSTCAIDCYIARNGRLGYDGLLCHDRTALWSLALNHGEDFVQRIATDPALLTDLPVRHIRGAAACIHGAGYNVYGHWLVDILPRLNVLTRAGYNILKQKFVLPYDCPSFGLEVLRLIGISSDQLIPYHPAREQVQLDELIVPTNLRNGNRLHSLFGSASLAWINRISPTQSLQTKPSRRLFISRTHIKSDRNMKNRSLIERMASMRGFEIIRPETLSLPDQIVLFRTARQLIGEYGSGLHNVLFGSRFLHCCALRGTSHWLGFIQSSIAQAFSQSTSYVFGATDTYAIDYEFEIFQEDFLLALDCLDLELLNQ